MSTTKTKASNGRGHSAAGFVRTEEPGEYKAAALVTLARPHFETHVNPIPGAGFSHYEIQTVREFISVDLSERWIETVHTPEQCSDDAEQAASPVMFAIYGRLREGGAEHLADRADLQSARDTLAKMIGAEVQA